jgi:hypothetical protein
VYCLNSIQPRDLPTDLQPIASLALIFSPAMPSRLALLIGL